MEYKCMLPVNNAQCFCDKQEQNFISAECSRESQQTYTYIESTEPSLTSKTWNPQNFDVNEKEVT